MILDRETGRPKGFGFVEMSTDAEAAAAVAKLNGHFIGDRKIFAVLGRVDKNKPAGYTPKPSFAPKPAAKPGFVERRSGKDRRGSAAPTPAPKWEKKTWVKKPFDKDKKPWVKKPFDAEKKPWVKKPFDPEKKPWAKKPFDKDKKPFVKTVPPVRGAKWVPKKPE